MPTAGAINDEIARTVTTVIVFETATQHKEAFMARMDVSSCTRARCARHQRNMLSRTLALEQAENTGAMAPEARVCRPFQKVGIGGGA
ncbi:MAG: hypothetical protein ABT24_14350 [Thiomonas sp. SCN 64-16]|nr:MAG: hypothetical protein ABT24_14350 [Thiomonas sp. SCN 64-16]